VVYDTDLDLGWTLRRVDPSRLPWDTPGAWWADVLVTFESQLGPREDWYEMGFVLPPGDSTLFGRLKKIGELCSRIGGERAVVSRIMPPMDIATIRWLQVFNAALVRNRAEDRRAIFGSDAERRFEEDQRFDPQTHLPLRRQGAAQMDADNQQATTRNE
jgi:hypothetical protein